MDAARLRQILLDHARFAARMPGGKRADLRGADLSGRNLSGVI